jgi:hypothetical protein
MTEADLDPRIITALGHWTYGVDTQEAFPDWDAAADLRARVLRGDCELHSLYLLMDGLVKAEREACAVVADDEGNRVDGLNADRYWQSCRISGAIRSGKRPERPDGK